MRNTVEETEKKFLREIAEEDFLGPYLAACFYVTRQLEQMNAEYSQKLGRTLIAQSTYRIKTPQSCLEKLMKKNCTPDLETAKERLGDIAGVRVICNFLDDIYFLLQILEENTQMEILKVKDYVKKPKASGYQSLHVIVSAPALGDEKRKVEIQIRTQAMNFWAVVEHHFVYKKGKHGKSEFEKDLKECARDIYKIDKKMLLIRKKMEDRREV